MKNKYMEDTEATFLPNSKGLKILLVEDNPDDEALILEAFKSYGMQNDVSVVSDGQEALDYLFYEGSFSNRTPHRLPDIIMMDLKIPKVSGLELIKRIRSERSTQLIPIVIFTSSADELDIIEGYRAGANSYIRKPVNFKLFSEAIHQFITYWLTWNEAPLKVKKTET